MVLILIREGQKVTDGSLKAVPLGRPAYIDYELIVYNSMTVSQKLSQPGASEHSFGATGYICREIVSQNPWTLWPRTFPNITLPIIV